MKKLLLTLLSFLASVIVFGQVQFDQMINIDDYLGLNKQQIKKVMKSEGIKPNISDKLYVIVNEKGSWDLDEKNYSYIFDYDDYHIISSFNNITDKCVRTHVKTKIDYFYDYVKLFDKTYKRSNSDLVWYGADVKIVIHFIISEDKYYMGIYYEKQ